jgi:hypothetical protein
MSEQPLEPTPTGAAAQVAKEQVDKILEAAEALGIELDETDATQWLIAMASAQASPGDVAIDVETGVYGHQVTLLDFDPTVLARYRYLADIVQLPDRPNIETAISLSGSAAQSRVQLFPGDADFFERVNITAPTREEAYVLLAQLMREKALDFFRGENYELVEVKFGTFLEPVVRDGEELKSGAPIAWSAEEVKAGTFEVTTAEGTPKTITWEYAAQEPGWCKMDWVITEPAKKQVVHTSNMLDVTWQTPEGEIVPLDGFLDPYFQEVYLEAESIPLFTKLVKHLRTDALEYYVSQLEREVVRYSLKTPPNFGKVAKRMYNIFRLTGRWPEAAFIRELFDEPAALLYQVGAVLDTLDEAVTEAEDVDREVLLDQIDELIRSVVRVAEGPEEGEIVDALLRLRDDISGRRVLGEERHRVVARSHQNLMNLVNDYFQTRLRGLPEIQTYLDELLQVST